MENINIDGGTPFDWGRTAPDYARFRDIYPPAFYEALTGAGVARPGQTVLDIGTGTGVLPRHLAPGGARFVGVDIAPEQIAEARRLSAEAGLGEGQVRYLAGPAEGLDLPTDSFDAVTACQCFHYFDVDTLVPNLARMLKPDGLLAILSMEWLPAEDEVVRRSEELVLKYNPLWSGGGYERSEAKPPQWAARHGFAPATLRAFDLTLTFTHEGWNGRMKACRGIGASLPPGQVAAFEAEHLALLRATAPEPLQLKHQAVMVVLKNEKPAAG